MLIGWSSRHDWCAAQEYLGTLATMCGGGSKNYVVGKIVFRHEWSWQTCMNMNVHEYESYYISQYDEIVTHVRMEPSSGRKLVPKVAARGSHHRLKNKLMPSSGRNRKQWFQKLSTDGATKKFFSIFNFSTLFIFSTFELSNLYFSNFLTSKWRGSFKRHGDSMWRFYIFLDQHI